MGCCGGAGICEVADVLTNVELEWGCEFGSGTGGGETGKEGEVAVVVTCVEHTVFGVEHTVFDGEVADEEVVGGWAATKNHSPLM
jgi:hypothetical protein